MLFVAPVISKALVHRNVCQQTLVAGMRGVPEVERGMAMNMPEMHHGVVPSATCDKSAAMDHLMSSGQVMSPMEEIACGYCLLLIHLPFVAFLLTVLLWLMLFCPRRAPVLQIVFTPVFRAWAPQCARAPPSVFLSAM
ncbi:DUF2946 domain-containing protein [Klebsiella indica]|uniref:DUF2946 domain-containing protein n=2 Tax=Klebsiella/Raoultella group TaxID=2890311 RepID=A0A5R9LCF8_9ENTR|nr:DUF2946 domain-containing protein [Klebsiella indica]